MKVQELMERVGVKQTGRALAYIRDGMEEINEKDKRFYDLPGDMIKIVDIRCKNQLNTKDEYRSIPRGVGSLTNKDADGK